jgi:hypothetical protein
VTSAVHILCRGNYSYEVPLNLTLLLLYIVLMY